MAANCCATAPYDCGTPAAPIESAPLAAGRKNVILAIMDDHGYCDTGFMKGRCVEKSDLTACDAPVCSNAPWIPCPSRDATIDCPADEAGSSGSCVDDVGMVCSNDPAVDCTAQGVSVCPPASCGEIRECVPGCTDRFRRACNASAECAATETCIDGLCSPRAFCDPGGGGGSFVCARGLGRCGPSSHTCLGNGQPCSQNADCDDVCQSLVVGGQTQWRCRFTPMQCATNADCCPDGDCAGTDWVCTTSRHPLRLADVSCRYRHNMGGEFHYDATSLPPYRENLVFTPEIDRLASEGVVFSRARASGNKCDPTRAVLATGRILRHRNAADQNNNHGSCRADAGWVFDVPIGCDDEDANGDGECVVGSTTDPSRCDDFKSNPFHDPLVPSETGGYHTVFWWAQPRPSPLGGEGLLETATHSGLTTADVWGIAAGKLELSASAAQVGWDAAPQAGQNSPAMGKFPCVPDDPSDTCSSALEAGRIPEGATDAASSASVIPFTKPMTDLIVNDRLTTPFFAWYGANLPHKGFGPGEVEFFNELYQPYVPSSSWAEEHLGRTSLFDAGLEAIRDELERTCVCGAGGAKESLWENTVVIVTPDNTYNLPHSKNAASEFDVSENATRVPMIIRDPDVGTAMVMDEQAQFATHWDVLPTALDYTNDYTGQGAGDYADQLNRYPLARNLRPWIEQGNAAGVLRDVLYVGHSAGGLGSKQGDSEPRFAMPRAGLIGRCSGSDRLCLLNHTSDCAGTCVPVRICVNGLYDAGGALHTCTTDGDCASCGQDGTCAGDFPDFGADTSCASPRDCAPVGACRPPLVKVIQRGTPGTSASITQVLEVNTNPDEDGAGNLVGTLLTPELEAEFDACLTEFWQLEPVPAGSSQQSGVWRPRDLGCPDPLRMWPTCTGSATTGPPDASACQW